ALGNLSNSDFDKREASTKELFELGEFAYPALVKVADGTDVEASRRAKDLIDRIKDAVPEELLKFRANDVIYTSDSKISGRIENASLRANTTAFGEVTVKLHTVRLLRARELEPDIDVSKLPDAPGTMSSQALLIGKSFVYRCTGNASGTIYGTDIYTSDSQVATAAVHAGVLKDG